MLILANKTESDIILKEEFEQLLNSNFVNILSQKKEDGYPHGHITKEFLKTNITDFSKKFYVCGPEPMMDAVTQQLYDLGVNEKAIIMEEF